MLGSASDTNVSEIRTALEELLVPWCRVGQMSSEIVPIETRTFSLYL